jgi:hypothetical protein
MSQPLMPAQHCPKIASAHACSGSEYLLVAGGLLHDEIAAASAMTANIARTLRERSRCIFAHDKDGLPRSDGLQ